MRIFIAKMGQSPYNRSIWTGLSSAFSRLGHAVQDYDAEQLPAPDNLDQRPDLLLAIHGANLDTALVEQYARQGITTAIYLLDEPYEVDRTTAWSCHYHWAFSVDRSTVAVHARHTNGAFLPLGYDDRVFCAAGPSIPSDILVLGSPFSARHEYLLPLRERFGPRITWVGPGWREFCPAGHHHEEFVTPEGCAAFYRGAAIVLNIHRDPFWSHFGDHNKQRIQATHLNPRFWESAACGAFQLVSERDDLHTFAPRAAAFNSPEQLLLKIDYFLSHDKARKDIAKRIHRGMAKHSYLHRAQTLLDTLGTRPAAKPVQ